jgi:hypothetical protein
MIKKEWFWMTNNKEEEHCHYSGLPSPMAYENKKTSKMKNDLKTSILIAMLGMVVLIGMIIILL